MCFKTVNGKRGGATKETYNFSGMIEAYSFKTVNGKRGGATIMNKSSVNGRLNYGFQNRKR